jgi:hypothetical protein
VGSDPRASRIRTGPKVRPTKQSVGWWRVFKPSTVARRGALL